MSLRHVSPSSWNAWLTCPLSWAARYVWHMEDPGATWNVAGNAFHEGAELLYSHPPEMRGSAVTTACKEAAVELWADRYREVGGTVDELAANLDRWFLALVSMEHPTLVEVVGLEQRLEVTLNGVPVKGFVDRVERSVHGKCKDPVLRVVDYKTGKRRPARRQMVLYAAGVEQLTGERVPAAELYYVDTAERETVLTGETAQRSVLKDLARVWDEMREAELTEHFPAKPTGLCKWETQDGRRGQCIYFDQCPQGKKYIREKGGRR